MIDPSHFVEHLGSQGVTLYTGVPDSLLKQLGSYIMAELPREQHIITANEGAAVAIAMGHYLRTSTPAVVYLQNSGIGNAINPLMSLADREVYGTPMIVVVGWRGRPGVKDEPQHVKQGRIMTELLDALDLPWVMLPQNPDEADAAMAAAVKTALDQHTPYVVLVEKGTFGDAGVSLPEIPGTANLPSREDALITAADAVGPDAVIVATTGMLSRELFEYRERAGLPGERDFLTVGGMGHASSIALGIALREPEREVWCFDGDGALLMHLGSLAVIADQAPPNYRHLVFNNQVHDSVGGQPTAVNVVDVAAAARALGYNYAASVSEVGSIVGAVAELRAHDGPVLLELKVRPGSRPGIGRPTRTPAQSKRAFMDALRPDQ
ncbi:MAG: phosphonopyruvate decarboxylase [Actinophytocola sp.]|nr:phosphonopyruvate decarboxylase [Actinophytocola sp.]